MLPDLLEAAEQGNATYKQLLLSIFETEVKGRNARRRKRNYAAAHFPPNIQPLEMYNPLELESGITPAQLSRLKELNWLDNKGNLVFAGPPGLGKTMVACGLGLEAINAVYTVCFEKMVNLIKLLDNQETDRAVGFRVKNLKKAQLIICDEIGYTPISRAQANRFFTFVSDMLDAVAAGLIGLGIQDVPTLRAAVERGLMMEDTAQINICGDPSRFAVPDFQTVQAQSSVFFSSAMKLRDSKPKINRGACIHCLCCQEFCPKGAIQVSRHAIMRLFGK